MTWIKNKKPFSLVISLLVTAFVTACVKNNSANQPPAIEKDLELDDEILSSDEILGHDAIRIDETLTNNTSTMTKRFRLSTDKILQLGIKRGRVVNDECSGNGQFEYRFRLYDEDRNQIEFGVNQKTKPLIPGDYQLVVSMVNGALCKQINMRFSLNTV